MRGERYGRCLARTGDLLLVRQALYQTELTARATGPFGRQGESSPDPITAGASRPARRPAYDEVVDRDLLWRAALLQAATVATLFLVLALLLPRSFFREYGALTGPLA